MSVLSRLQRGLEALYRVESGLDVDAFVVDEAGRDEALAGDARRPREQLLVSHDGDDLALGLFLDSAALANLERHDPATGISDANFWDFCLAIEGVSHFIYVARCAAADRAVTALELELQAEVDKWVTCTMVEGAWEGAELRERLYGRPQLAGDLDEDERARYQTANDEARRFAGSLWRRYVDRRRLGEMLPELRHFYRLGLPDKLRHIARAA